MAGIHLPHLCRWGANWFGSCWHYRLSPSVVSSFGGGVCGKEFSVFTRSFYPIMRTPPSCPHVNLITSPKPHFLIPSHWDLGLQLGIFWGGEGVGQKHSVHNNYTEMWMCLSHIIHLKWWKYTDHQSKALASPNADKKVEQRTLIHCWWECKILQPFWEMVWWFLAKLSILLPYDLAIVLLDIYPNDLKSFISTQTCAWVFVVALFLIAQLGNTKMPLVGE
jgi:hypothetical protein